MTSIWTKHEHWLSTGAGPHDLSYHCTGNCWGVGRTVAAVYLKYRRWQLFLAYPADAAVVYPTFT